MKGAEEALGQKTVRNKGIELEIEKAVGSKFEAYFQRRKQALFLLSQEGEDRIGRLKY